MRLTDTVEQIYSQLADNADFMQFIQPDDPRVAFAIQADDLPFVIFHTLDNKFEIYIATWVLNDHTPSETGPFALRVIEAIQRLVNA